MEVCTFHNEIKKIFCSRLHVQPSYVFKLQWCKNMFPKNFYTTFIYPNINLNNKHIFCCEFFCNELQELITCDKYSDSYIPCISIIVKYVALLYVNHIFEDDDDPFLFLNWFDVNDVKNVLLFEQQDNDTMFDFMEYLKLDRLVLTTTISQLETYSIETMPKCKNLIKYFQIITGQEPISKPFKVVNSCGFNEEEAIRLRQCFEHIRISRSILDDHTGSHSYTATLRTGQPVYRNSEFVCEKKNKPDCKNLFIPINDLKFSFNFLLLYDTKKSKVFEFDYLNALMLMSLSDVTKYIYVDSLLFSHNYLLAYNFDHLFDTRDSLTCPQLSIGKTIEDYGKITKSLNDLLQWTKLEKENNGPKATSKIHGPDYNRMSKTLFESVSPLNRSSPASTFSSSSLSSSTTAGPHCPTTSTHPLSPPVIDISDTVFSFDALKNPDNYEKYTSDFAVAVSDSLLHINYFDDIEKKFNKIRQDIKSNISDLMI